MSPFRSLRRHAAVFALALALLAGGAAVPASAQGLVLQGLGGERLSEADLAQGGTIFIVWASWSPHCRNVFDRVNRIAQRWGGRARVATVSFQEERGAVESFLSGKNPAATVYLDTSGAFSKKYAVANLPFLLILKDGQVVYRSKLPEDPDRVIAEIFP